MENNKYLYGLTVQGIQSYIFETNKLREIVGASEIVEKMCTTWFKTFIDKKGIEGKFYLKAAGNIRFETEDENSAKTIFKKYHKKLLKKAPGVPFSQAVVEIDNNDENKAIDELDAKLRAQRNRPLYDFDLGLMARRKNRRTGNPAYKKATKSNDNEILDIITWAKHENKEATALQKKTDINGITYPIEFKIIAKGSTKSWLALIHIDGNGMGKRINKIRERENVLKSLKGFSENVEKSTIAAYQKGVEKVIQLLKNNNEATDTLPMRPIVLGGDDLTLIIRADLALAFTYAYLDEFEKQTEENLKDYGGKLTAAAGIVFVKEKFPFHYSAHLAEELTSYAKNISKRKHSCLHFHMVQDSFVDSYKDIIKKDLTVLKNEHKKDEKDKKFEFIKGPYFLNKTDAPSISVLLSDIKELKKEDAPTNAMREWIDVKFNNPEMADTIMERIKRKYGNNYLKIINNTKAYIDYHTLISVGTKF